MAALSIVGKATEGDSDHYFLTLETNEMVWVAGERQGASKVFKTKTGPIVFKPAPDKGTYLNNPKGDVICFLRNLALSDTYVGEAGDGNVLETARNIDWKVQSV
jgi:hypothetical protein